jgi:hypothetical protein
MTMAKVEKKKLEEVSQKNSKASTENINYANGNGNTENKRVNKPKQKGFLKGVANFLGYDSPTEMIFVAAKIFTATVFEAASRKIVNKMFGGNSDSGPSIFDNQGNEKTYKDSVEIKNITNERANTNNSTHASPRAHIVKGHGQHYNTKEGPIWKEKEPFPRGKKNESI